MELKLNALGLIAVDLQATIAFYERLGCAFEGEGTHVEAQLGSFRLMLDTEEFVRENGFLERPLAERNGFGLAVECDSPGTVNAVFDELAADGFAVRPPFDAPWGQRYATVHDPDGTNVDLYAWQRD